MKRLFFAVATLAAVLAVSCGMPEGGDRPTINILNASGITLPDDAPDNLTVVAGPTTAPVAAAPLVNGGFRMVLPDAMPDSELRTVGLDPMLNGAKASDPAARYILLPLNMVSGDVPIPVGSIHYYIGGAEDPHSACLVYADRPVTLAGNSRWLETIGQTEFEMYSSCLNLKLARGWNLVNVRTMGSSGNQIHTTLSNVWPDSVWSVSFLTWNS